MKRKESYPLRKTVRLQRDLNRTGSTSQGWGAVIVGTPFVAIGLVALLAETNVIAIGNIRNPEGAWAILGVIFGTPGALFYRHGIAGIVRKARAQRMREQYSTQPWQADFPWDARGIGDSIPTVFWQRLVTPLFLSAFMTPFHFAVFKMLTDPKWYSWVMLGIVALLDLVVVVCLVRLFQIIVQWLKHGRSRLRFTKFPFFLGEDLEMDIECSRPVKAIGEASLTLRYIHDVVESSGSRESRSQSIVCHQVYEDVWTIQPNEWNSKISAGLHIRALLPEDTRYSNRLTEVPAHYWDLEINVPTAGMDYRTNFLLPVYARSELSERP